MSEVIKASDEDVQNAGAVSISQIWFLHCGRLFMHFEPLIALVNEKCVGAEIVARHSRSDAFTRINTAPPPVSVAATGGGFAAYRDAIYRFCWHESSIPRKRRW